MRTFKQSNYTSFGVVSIVVCAVSGFVWFSKTDPVIAGANMDPSKKVRVTVSMFSGRHNPYFFIPSADVIEEKIKDLPTLKEAIHDQLGANTFHINLSEEKYVTVYDNGITIGGRYRKCDDYRDVHGLRQYLIEMKAKSELIDGGTDLLFTR